MEIPSVHMQDEGSFDIMYLKFQKEET